MDGRVRKSSTPVLALLLVIVFAGARVSAQQLPTSAHVLYDLLATKAFDESELPRGFVRPIVSRTAPENVDDGAFGGVDVAVSISDFAGVAIATHRIEYRFYETPADAERAIQLARAQTERLGGLVSSLAGFDYPALLLQSVGTARGSAAAGSVCLVHVGEILITGIAVLEPHAKGQADLNAANLAQAGVSHLDRLIADAASATPPPAR